MRIESAGAAPSTLPSQPTWGASLVLVAAYLLICVGSVCFFRTRLAMPAGSELSLPRSVFTSANAASLTGFRQVVPVESYTRLGQTVILILVLAGSLTSLIVGGAAVTRIIGLGYSMPQIVQAALVFQSITMLIGSGALLARGEKLFESLFHAASAVGNCGIVLGNPASIDDPALQALILPMALIGGLGITVLMELVQWLRTGRRLSGHAKTVLACTAGIYLLGTANLVALAWPLAVPQGSTRGEELKRVVLESSTTVLNNRSLGWPVESAIPVPRTWMWIVLLIILIGASPGGTGGGLKTTTIVELGRGTFRALCGRAVPRVFGFSMVWLALYLLLLLATTTSLTMTEPQLPGDQLLFIAASAIGNVGASPNPISITGDGLYILSAGMILGRLLSLAILWCAALTTRQSEVAVG